MGGTRPTKCYIPASEWHSRIREWSTRACLFTLGKSKVNYIATGPRRKSLINTGGTTFPRNSSYNSVLRTFVPYGWAPDGRIIGQRQLFSTLHSWRRRKNIRRRTQERLFSSFFLSLSAIVVFFPRSRQLQQQTFVWGVREIVPKKKVSFFSSGVAKTFFSPPVWTRETNSHRWMEKKTTKERERKWMDDDLLVQGESESDDDKLDDPPRRWKSMEEKFTFSSTHTTYKYIQRVKLKTTFLSSSNLAPSIYSLVGSEREKWPFFDL